MDISVIIVHYRASCFLEQCLHSVQRALKGYQSEIWVIDNHSADDSRDYLEHLFQSVQFRWLDKNLGFSAANNIALRESRGKYILFLNPDTILPEDFFSLTVSWFQQHPSCGALGVRMLDGSGLFLKESKRGLPTPMRSLCKMAGLARLFPRSKTWAGYYAGHLPEKESQPVEVLAGACFMLTKEAAWATGGFDERFFMYAEDIDLSLRISQAGWENHYLSMPSIVHFKGESTRKLTISYIRHFYGAMSLFIDKHYAEKKGLKMAMKSTVFLARVFSTAGMYARRIVFSSWTGAPKKPVNTLLVSSQEGFNEVIRLAAFSPIPMRICGRVSPGDHDQAYTLGPVAQLKRLIAEQQAEAVVFCLGDIPAQEAIRFMEENNMTCRFYFHYRGSQSMVSSHNRNHRGDQVRLSRPISSAS